MVEQHRQRVLAKLWAPAATLGLAGLRRACRARTSPRWGDTGGYLVPGRLSSRSATEHADAVIGTRAVDGRRFRPGHRPLAIVRLNDALKNDFGAEAVRYSLLPAAVTPTPGGRVVHLGGAVDPRRYSPGELIDQLARRPLPVVFVIVFIRPTSPRPALLSINRPMRDLHHRCFGEKQAKTSRMKPFCRNRETILKQMGRTSLANRGRQRCPGGIT